MNTNWKSVGLMRICIFGNARPGVPFIFDGGAERTTFSLVSGLAHKGMPVMQICTFPRGDIELGAANAASMGVACSRKSGEVELSYDGSMSVRTRGEHLLARDGLLSILAVHPSEFQPVCRDIVAQKKCRLLVTWLKGSDQIVRLGSEFNVPTVLCVVGPYSPEGYPELGPDTFILANSPVTAQVASEYYGRRVNFILGIVDHASYIAEHRTPRYITYVNPRTEKGIHLFCKIAALLPGMPFLVIRGWSRDKLKADELQAMEFISSLPNVTLVSSMQDMREVYRLTSILLLPSRWQESWARVIGEVQANGIPVIASNRGSSPQSVGDGGVILEYGEPDLWADVIRLIYHNDELKAELGDCARLNTRRFNPAEIIADYVAYFSNPTHAAQDASGQCRQDKVRVVFGSRDGCGAPRLQHRAVNVCADFDCSEPTHPYAHTQFPPHRFCGEGDDSQPPIRLRRSLRRPLPESRGATRARARARLY